MDSLARNTPCTHRGHYLSHAIYRDAYGDRMTVIYGCRKVPEGGACHDYEIAGAACCQKCEKYQTLSVGGVPANNNAARQVVEHKAGRSSTTQHKGLNHG